MKKLVILLTLCVIPLTQFAQKASDYLQAANQGYANAQYNLGGCYEYGYGVQQNYYKAVEWYTKAANQGMADAQFLLGGCYYLGQGAQKNESLAKMWIKDAANKGQKDAIESCRMLGW